ncbi:MAG: cytochrome c [Terriglobales bacterium]
MKSAIKLVLMSAMVTLVLSATALAADPDPQIVALYKAKCSACHGADGKAATPAGKKLNTRSFALPEIMKAPDADLIEITARGKNKMPGFAKSLKEDQIKSLVAYIRGLTNPPKK